MSQEESGIVIIPSITVNQAPINGDLAVETVFQAICASFAEDSSPDVCICQSCGDLLSIKKCIPGGECPRTHAATKAQAADRNARNAIPFSVFVVSLLSLVVLLGIAFYVQRQREQRHFRANLVSIMVRIACTCEGWLVAQCCTR